MMNQKQLFFIILFLVVGIFLFISGIVFNNQSETIIQSGTPERIISLSPNLTEILYELGLGEKIVAVTSDSDYPLDTKDKQKVGTFWQPNVETIIAYKPDLTITLWFEQQKSIANSLKNNGYKTLTLKIETIEELFEAIQKIGFATDCSNRAELLTNNIQNRIDTIKAQYSDKNKVKVLWVIQAEPVRVAGRNTFINELIESAGGENAIGSTIQQYPPISSEDILTCDAQVIIQSAMDSDNIEKQQKDAEIFWSRFPNVPAVKNKKIYVINSDTILRLGPRLPEGIETIAKYLHPEIAGQYNDM